MGNTATVTQLKPRTFFWRSARAQNIDEPTEIVEPPPPRISIDRIADDIRHAQNRVVTCQCELAKAEIAVENLNDLMATALIELDKELAFRPALTAKCKQIETKR